MTDFDNAPSSAELYVVATNATSLKSSPGRSPIDYVAAAGMLASADDSLGAMLLRLLGEYDNIRGSVRAGNRRAAEAESLARATQAAAKGEAKQEKFGPTQAERMRQEAVQIERDAAAAALLTRYETMTRLKTLAATREAFGDYACKEANRRTMYTISDRRAQVLAGKVLHALMEPRCAYCEGRGFNGSSIRGEIEQQCKMCVVGLVKDKIGDTDDERNFADHLYSRAEAKISAAATGIGHSVRTDESRAEPAPTKLPAFGAGLPAKEPTGSLADLQASAAVARASSQFGDLG